MWDSLIHLILHLLGRPISHRLSKRIGAVSPSDVLSPAELVRLTPQFAQLRRRRTVVGIVTVAICLVTACIGFYAYVHFAEPVPIEPVLDQRAPFRRRLTPFLGLLVGGLLAAHLGRFIVFCELGTSAELFWQFLATTEYRNARRGHWWTFIVGWPIAVAMFLLLINPGLVVDSHGILSPSGLFSATLHPYEKVAEIMLYARVDAPAGIIQRDNARILLKDGGEVRLDYEGGKLRFPPIKEVVAFISKQSGVAITNADIRPK